MITPFSSFRFSSRSLYLYQKKAGPFRNLDPSPSPNKTGKQEGGLKGKQHSSHSMAASPSICLSLNGGIRSAYPLLHHHNPPPQHHRSFHGWGSTINSTNTNSNRVLLFFPAHSKSSTRSCLSFARRRNKNYNSSSSFAPPPPPPTKGKGSLQLDNEDDLDEDAFEALFSQLEEDLKNDNLLGNDSDDEITEEDLALLEKELEEALGDEVDDDISGSPSSSQYDIDTDDEEEEEVQPKLKNWQLRRLAAALKIGRRKTSIKSLAAELGLDRTLVLELLRHPPPNLLLMSASLSDKAVEAPLETQNKQVESPPTAAVEHAEPEIEVKTPIHAMQTRWSIQKRLKKVQVAILEKVYYRTKRPTNTMISSIVQVTNLPWKTVVKWFEDKRLEEGVPMQRLPFHRPVSRSP